MITELKVLLKLTVLSKIRQKVSLILIVIANSNTNTVLLTATKARLTRWAMTCSWWLMLVKLPSRLWRDIFVSDGRHTQLRSGSEHVRSSFTLSASKCPVLSPTTTDEPRPASAVTEDRSSAGFTPSSSFWAAAAALLTDVAGASPPPTTNTLPSLLPSPLTSISSLTSTSGLLHTYTLSSMVTALCTSRKCWTRLVPRWAPFVGKLSRHLTST